MMKKMMLGWGVLTLSALLGACDSGHNTSGTSGGGTEVTPPVAQVPVVGKSLEMQNLPTVLVDVRTTAKNLLIKDNPDIDPDVKLIWDLFAPSNPIQPGSLENATTVSQQWLSQIVHSSIYKLGAQSGISSANVTRVSALPTGTWKDSGYDGTLVKVSELPTTGLIINYSLKDIVVNINWQVNGSPITKVRGLAEGCDMQDCYSYIHEIPTNASGTLSKGGTVIAQGAMTLKPGGNCDSPLDVAALTGQVSVGRNSVKAAEASASYSWDGNGINFQAAGNYHTKTQVASTNFKLAVNGTSGNRCDAKNVYFTPTSASLTGALTLPDHSIAGKIDITNLSNLTISESALKIQNPFKDVGGFVDGSVSYNGNVAITAKGNLADGNDADLTPGDQVVVSYIKRGQLVTANLEDAYKDLQSILR